MKGRRLINRNRLSGAIELGGVVESGMEGWVVEVISAFLVWASVE